MPKLRLDLLLVERGLFPTRTKAQAALMAGKVEVEGHPQPKAGTTVPPDVRITVKPDAVPYVSRGGLKLQAALDHFKVDPRGRTAIDVGSSTGGFTDCLLQRGALKVYAVDVGTAQLDAKLRADPRVVVMEQTHAARLTPGMFPQKPDLATADVSFISLTKILPALLPCLARPAQLILLVKPQFELEPKKTPKGVVRKEEYRQEALAKVRSATQALGLLEDGLLESPLKGPKGNTEYLLCLKAQL
ncbi:MAG TPA: TlyA family rRNA (cytidine-2'-O)-methyltransferase [Elusimicrobia bacterium]|nr:TlyA family rRNA (cytidine-2'-O)-methyltransferase [Elusimicrobiota bacterium]